MTEDIMMRTIKDSVFCDLFSQPRYVRELYGALHPEDANATEQAIEIVTRQCIITIHPYNDLGLTVDDTLLILVEAQSTWSNNIAARALMYVADTLRDWVSTHHVSLYDTGPVRLPRPELYVVYTGDREDIPNVATLDTCFGAPADVAATVHVLRGGTDDIIGQYVDFAHITDSWRERRGRTREAILGAIRECIERGILVEYLTERENEVIGIMMTLYDAEEVQREWRRHVAREAKEQGWAEGRAKGLQEGLQEGRAKGLQEGRAKGLQEGLAEGLAEGRAEGRAEGERNLGALISTLLAAGRTDDAARAAADEQARGQLYAEMGIA